MFYFDSNYCFFDFSEDVNVVGLAISKTLRGINLIAGDFILDVILSPLFMLLFEKVIFIEF